MFGTHVHLKAHFSGTGKFMKVYAILCWLSVYASLSYRYLLRGQLPVAGRLAEVPPTA